jgi:hypothetical protein
LVSSSPFSSRERHKKPVSFAFGYLSSPETRRQYRKLLELFFDFVGLPGNDLDEKGRAFLDKVATSITKVGGGKTTTTVDYWVEETVMDFLTAQKQRVNNEELAESTLKNFSQPIKLFCDINDMTTAAYINWKRISRAFSKGKNYSSIDRSPTDQEIQKLVEYPDRRIKPIVYVMCSSGIRSGAWNYLQLKHVIPMKNDKGEIIAAKLIVYAGTSESYFTFMTPEAYNALKEYMDFRSSYGENITDNSYLVRDNWRTVDIKRGGGEKDKGGRSGLATNPKKLSSKAIQKILIRAWSEQGLRQALPPGVRRHEFKGAHGFRKFFKSHAEQVMKSVNVETLMGHKIGLSQSYYRPTEHELLQDYLKAVDLLTINDNKSSALLQKQVAELTEKSKEENYIIKGKLAEKEKELEAVVGDAEQTRKELAELKAKQEEAARKQQMDIEQMKAQLGNTTDQVGMLLEMLSKIQKQEAKDTSRQKDFVLRELGVLTKGKIGEDPETGLIVEPVDSEKSGDGGSKRCVICSMIEKKRKREEKDNQTAVQNEY